LVPRRLAKRGVAVCIPSKSNRKVAIPYDAVLYEQRHKSKTCSDGSKIGAASTPDTTRCAHTYFSAICIAAAVAFWL
jgi:hypothetical protein